MKEDYHMDVKKEFVKVVLGILFIILMGVFIRYMQFGFWGVYLTLILMGLVLSIVFKQFKVWNFVKSCIIMFLFLNLMYWLGDYGWIGFIVSTILLIAWILYNKRQQYMKTKWHIESMIWGKPLKEYVKEGKPIPKIKIKF